MKVSHRTGITDCFTAPRTDVGSAAAQSRYRWQFVGIVAMIGVMLLVGCALSRVLP